MNTAIKKQQVLELMASIEETSGKMMHEFDSELESKCIDALDGNVPLTFVINRLSKELDRLRGAS